MLPRRTRTVKVVEQAMLMGVPAVQIGNVGGTTLTVKTASGEFSAPLMRFILFPAPG